MFIYSNSARRMLAVGVIFILTNFFSLTAASSSANARSNHAFDSVREFFGLKQTVVSSPLMSAPVSHTFTVIPASQSVPPGSTNNFAFVFLASNSAGNLAVTFTIPTGWTPPTMVPGPGNVTVEGGTCGAVLTSVIGDTITVDQGSCNSNETFTINYNNATAPNVQATYAFLSNLVDVDPVVITGVPSPTPTETPTSTPTATPTNTPTATPTNTPTATPTATPTSTPTATPTSTPTSTPTATPTSTPTATPTATPVCPTLSMPTSSSVSGIDIAVPVEITDVTGLGIVGIDFTFTFDPAVLVPVYTTGTQVSTSPGTVGATAVRNANELSPGVVKVSIFSSGHLVGAGPVIFINMRVVGNTGTSTPLTLTEVLYNGGLACSTLSNGSHSVVQALTSTSVSSSMNPSVFGNQVTFTAFVSSVPPVGNNGTVDFVIDGAPACTAVSLVAGSATCQTSNLDVPNSPHSVSAIYSGSLNFATSSGSLAGGQALTPAASSTMINCPMSVPYNGSAQDACVANVTGVGGLITTVPVVYTNNRNVGTAAANASYPGGPNHMSSEAMQATFGITSASLTISAVTDTKAYDGTTSSSATPSVTGLQTGDTVSPLTQAFASKNVLGTNLSTLSVASFTVNDGNSGSNYTVDSSGTATGTITAASLTISAVTDSKVYDGTTSSSGTPSVIGLKTGDTVSPLTQVFGSKNVLGTNNSILQVTDFSVNDGNMGGNYTVNSSNTAPGTITPAVLTISAVTDSKVYDGTTSSSATPTAVGLQTGDTVSPLTQVFASKNVLGINLSTLSVSGVTVNDGNSGNNYTVNSSATAMGTITAAPLAISAVTDTKVYDATTASSATPSVMGLQTGDSVSPLTQVFQSANVLGLNGSTLLLSAFTVNDGNMGGNYTVSSSGTAMGTITKAGAACTVTGYNVTYDAMPHTATGSCLGVLSETLVGLNVSATSHTDVGSYPNDPWTFTDSTGNYNDDNGTVSSLIGSGNITGGVSYAIDPKPVPGVDLNGAGANAVTGSTDTMGSYSLTDFGSGAYTVTPSKATQLCGTSNGVFANDAGLIAQHVVGLIALTPTQVAAAKVSGPSTPGLSSFDAGLIAQKVVGNCSAMNFAGQWRFTPESNNYAAVTAGLVDNYTAYMLGDVNGDWNPAAAHRTQFASADDKDAVHASLASVFAAPGSEVTVPLRVENLRGRSVGSYQFDIEYDPAVIRPAQVAASVGGTISQSQGLAYNSPRPGLLKVAVYSGVPVNGDGIYVDLKFTVVGRAGSSTALTIADFRMNDGTDAISVANGNITVARQVDNSYVIGRLTTKDVNPVTNAVVSLKGTGGRIRSSN